MPDLLLELFSEEIPARFQRRAADDLRRLVTDALVERGLLYEGAKAFVTPRRLALAVSGVPSHSPDSREEKKGPKVGAPQQAIEGFLRAAGLASIEQARVASDPKKGDFYVALIEKRGAPAPEIIADLLPPIFETFPWPKSMRWGTGRTSWVRPLRAITATFASENEEPAVIDFTVAGVRSGQMTYGHRFLAPDAIRVRRLDDYTAALEKAKVVLDLDRRRDIIRTDAEHLAFAQGLSLISDEGLLEEVAGLVEWPVVMMGRFDAQYLDLPEEVIIATIRANQKCFCLRGADGRLAPNFLLVANTAPADAGEVIIAGNERVIRARLSDARFFYQGDLAIPLAEGVERLKGTVFHAKLGSQLDRVQRIEALAGELAPLVGADPGLARRAARLAKADLVSGMVGEFPELQGLMGRYYAAAQGEPDAVANAIEDHYRPLGPTDRTPTEPVAIAVALADKLDLLTGFWAIGEKPTGSRDPFALRRAALGVIRIITENALNLLLTPLVRFAYERTVRNQDFAFRLFYENTDSSLSPAQFWKNSGDWSHLTDTGVQVYPEDWSIDFQKKIRVFERNFQPDDVSWIKVKGEQPLRDSLLENSFTLGEITTVSSDLLAFFHDRLKVALRDKGARHDLVDAVITETSDDIFQVTRRVDALWRLLDTEDGRNLLAGYRRAGNIVVAEEKKDGRAYRGADFRRTDAVPEELALRRAVDDAHTEVGRAVAVDDYEGAISALSALRAPVDRFFDAVLVNDADPDVRGDRLTLLARLRDTMHLVADFSKIAG